MTKPHHKYTKNQLWQVIKMLMQDYALDCGEELEYIDNEIKYISLFEEYMEELKSETYIDKFGYIRCKHCQEEIELGRCCCEV